MLLQRAWLKLSMKISRRYISLQLSEPVTAMVIYLYIMRALRRTGITKEDGRCKTNSVLRLDHRASFSNIQQIHVSSQESVVLLTEHHYWASDNCGREPILLLGPSGLAVSAQFWIVGFVLGHGVNLKRNGYVHWQYRCVLRFLLE